MMTQDTISFRFSILNNSDDPEYSSRMDTIPPTQDIVVISLSEFE